MKKVVKVMRTAYVVLMSKVHGNTMIGGWAGTKENPSTMRGSVPMIIEQHYRDNQRKLLKRMYFRAGTQWDAEDVVQEAYARAIKYFKSFDGSNFDRWFNTILNNTLREYKNTEKGFASTSFDEEEMGETPCTYFPDRVATEISELIDTKSLVQIEVLTLYFKQGLSAKDVSRVTEYSYAASHQIIQRFRNELKELYG